MSEPFIVTIDGPAGVGKSTMARRVARELNICYLDTGAMFRTIALRAAPDGAGLSACLRGLVFSLERQDRETVLLCNGVAVGAEIRTEEAGMMASRIARLPEVRAFLKNVQQDLGAAMPLVAEGRDMGTVVFPRARCKFFLDARPEVRARRRQIQLAGTGRDVPLEELTQQIRARDHEDRTRSIAPLLPAPDACLIDTSDLSSDGVFAAIMRQVAGPCRHRAAS